MIIARTPFRISFSGGGTDLKTFYRERVGAVISTSINKYVYIAAHPFFYRDQIQVKYSKTELCLEASKIEHPIFREVLEMFALSGVDLNSIADVPAGTGLGSSSSFTVCLLNSIHAYIGKDISKQELAELACDIEINRLGSPIGKQDQFAAAFGGLNHIEFFPDESVAVSPIVLDDAKKRELSENLVMVYTGDTRSADRILREQIESHRESRPALNQAYSSLFALTGHLKKSLESGRIDDFGSYLHEGWELKKLLSKSISNSHVDEIYRKGLAAGALGGKLLGAGGAGFILFYCPNDKQEEFFAKLEDSNSLNFQFEDEGSKIIYNGEVSDGF